MGGPAKHPATPGLALTEIGNVPAARASAGKFAMSSTGMFWFSSMSLLQLTQMIFLVYLQMWSPCYKEVCQRPS